MNIYNDSQATSSTNYPPAPTFTTIDTNNILISNGLEISGATKGGILICEDNLNNIGELVLAGQDFVLASDLNNTGLPIWRNNLTLNEVITNQIKIPTVTGGDLLVGQNSNYLGRLPIGPVDTVLFSDGTNLGYLPRSAGNSYYENAGTGNNIPLNVSNIIFNAIAMDFFIGKRYKITVSGRIQSQGSTVFQLLFNGTTIANFTYLWDNDMSRTVIYTSPGTGTVNLQLTGFANIVNSSILNFIVTSEEF